MFDEKTDAAVGIIIILLFVVAIMIWEGNSMSIAEFENRVSEDSLSAGMYYYTQALSCLSKNPDAIDETERFILDRSLLDSEVLDHGRISCAEYGEIKYWLGVYDLDRKEGQWTFKNYEGLESALFVPKYGQIVLINDGGKMHRAFIGARIESPAAKSKLPLELFCNTTAKNETADFNRVFDTGFAEDKGYGIEDAYYYNTNNCESETCIKGPAQAIPTCQPAWCTYAKAAGESCDVKCECKSFSCTAGKCDDKSRMTLISGQPCSKDSECESGICAYGKRCGADRAAGIDITRFAFPK